MKNLFTATLLFFVFNAFSQTLRFEKHYDSIFDKAKFQNKLVSIFLFPNAEVPVPAHLIDVRKNKQLAEVYNKYFALYSPNTKDTLYKHLRKKYEVDQTPAILFLDQDEKLIYTAVPSLRSAEGCLNAAQTAIDKQNSGKTFGWYLDEYKKGNRDTSFLRDYIMERQKAGIQKNYRHAEEYGKQLSISQINTVEKTSFLLKAGLVYQSPLYTVLFANKKVVDSSYKSLTLGERMDANRKIFQNTMDIAVRTKNASMAMKAAEYRRNSWQQKDYRLADFIYNRDLISYYRTIKDSITLINRLNYFVDQHFLNVKPDTLAKYKKLYPELTRELKEENDEKPEIFDKDISNKIISNLRAGIIVRAPMELNNAAWDVYRSKSRDQSYLSKAMLWSKHSILLNPDVPEYYDTLAHILYRLELYSEAEDTQMKAIRLAQSKERNASNFINEYKKIQARRL